jgi:alkylation response protein AidB-like acyl-CoA dehydrogenase
LIAPWSIDFYCDAPFLQRLVQHYCRKELPDLQEELIRFLPPPHSGGAAWPGLVKRFLLQQIGEAGANCPMACTEGLVALIDEFPQDRHPELDRILLHCKEGLDGDFGIGAQFMTEIRGGSDIPSNLLEAQPEGDHFRIYGTKFFCSAAHADYSVITTKVTGSEEVGTIRKAMSIFGGHGVVEDFSRLPRLFRDATVNELWGGPRNVLLMQVFRDVQRVSSWYPPEELVGNLLRGASADKIRSLSGILKSLLNNPSFF